ncbi:hypothetical protein K144316041_p20820 (plasmid) [Clostridium tetani]|uniref:hypothetical protein n=1 Tax=Clostridium tetani TaxID=1513 RepID=UPI0029554209|nr:hypothetical protein [Clostridium tetani]BDR74243.1 hypothetical protein K144316041_p20820 [Clostridium tetani]
MDFISGMMLGNLLNNTTYHNNSISDFELDSISSQIETQNKIMKENNKKNNRLKEMKIKMKYFDKYTDNELLELLKKTPEYIEGERVVKITGGLGEKTLYSSRGQCLIKNKKYQNILNEIKRRNLEFNF